MKLVAIGINHRTAPIEIREKLFLRSLEVELFISEMKNDPLFVEGFVLSTCNRTEVYVHSLDDERVVGELFKLLSNIKNIPIDSQLREHFYVYKGDEAIEHLFKVACGLDSLVVGEKQIMGQIKAAIDLSRKMGMLSTYFNILTNLAIRVGKKARTETQIGAGGTSISWAAVLMAQRVLKGLENKSVLVLGAGKMGELSVKQLQEKGIKDVYVANRTQCTAVVLAEKIGGEAVSFCDIKDVLCKVDVCICSVSAPHYILEKDIVEKIMLTREDRPLLFIDISMPRNIDPQVAKIPHAHLFAIDDLNNIVKKNLHIRQSSINEVEKIIAQKMKHYYQKVCKIAQARLKGVG